MAMAYVEFLPHGVDLRGYKMKLSGGACFDQLGIHSSVYRGVFVWKQ